MVYTDIYISLTGKQPEEQNREADFIMSKNTYKLDQIVEEPGNRLFYNLQGGHDRAFVCEELKHISEDTQAPPEWVSNWK